MRLVNMTCPNCGAQLQVDADRQQVFCEHCGTKLLMQDEVQRIRYDDAEDAGYLFEKGRQRAIAEAEARRIDTIRRQGQQFEQPHVNRQPPPQTYTQPTYDQPRPRKRRTWLWILGWLFIFPVPLTILMNRKKNMHPVLRYSIIIIAWIIYIGWMGNGGG